ncbi:Acetyl-CoA acetyltransferase erg10A, mitochondrial [Exophiala xenobiotica]|uniref:Acetyl-CoA acetyltransferase erg10A, mitochondrial n=1 Tax=Lithohypha guttulata TaxID=1690604 RepID=A0ABR0KGA3_9EURO|nr:Acetyl-CoA acetyltransferase erg10A, mitochondrial [Lithohypha guttulata]KAK5323499.1 Acetyl-CoA acetyltransferase erg10A, mitochondrial [Exophiala xenobiotica]
MSKPTDRLAQVQRHFSTTPTARQEIRDVYILSASRTPVAKFNGSLMSMSAPQLGAVAIKSALEKSKVPIEKITDVYMGNVLQGNMGQAPARQASIFAGLPPTVEAVTINKVCASGMKAVTFAAQNIMLGVAEAQVAGGMESMSRVPYYLNRAAQQPPFGHMKIEDGLIKDGLWDVYNQFHMGVCAEKTAKKYNISRQAQDEYAIRSFRRAQAAWKEGKFDDEVVPVTVKSKKGETVISKDEGFDNLREDKVATLKPAFVFDGTGTVTAANSSTFNDGASALVLGSKEIAQQYGSGSRVLAKIISQADAAIDPVDFPVAPAKAVPIALGRAGLKASDIAYWEFNEAFAAVILANSQILGLENAKNNMLGGAISLGHALGSSGSRILTTLLHQLKPGEYGCAAICNGGGAASAMIVQRIESV